MIPPRLNNVKKTALFLYEGFPYLSIQQAGLLVVSKPCYLTTLLFLANFMVIPSQELITTTYLK